MGCVPGANARRYPGILPNKLGVGVFLKVASKFNVGYNIVAYNIIGEHGAWIDEGVVDSGVGIVNHV